MNQTHLTDGALDTGMLSFQRSLQLSEALMWAHVQTGGGTVRKPVLIETKGIRGQTANHVARSKRDTEKVGESNIQTVEFASMPAGSEALEISFSLRVLAGSAKPHACNDADVTRTYQNLSQEYAAQGGYDRLAARYVWNLTNGGFAWRNAFQVDQADVTLSWGDAGDESITLHDVARISRTRPATAAEIAALDGIGGGLSAEEVQDRLDELTRKFAEALHDPDKPLTVRVVWHGIIGEGQEVFPSQEYLNETAKRGPAKHLSRVLASIPTLQGERQASIHSQKIGAALRRIDDWHGHPGYEAVVVNPYSGILETGDVLRQGRSFYEMRAEPSALFAPGKEGELDFVMANLIRGGVFGVENENKAAGRTKGKGAKGAKTAPAHLFAEENAVDG